MNTKTGSLNANDRPTSRSQCKKEARATVNKLPISYVNHLGCINSFLKDRVKHTHKRAAQSPTEMRSVALGQNLTRKMHLVVGQFEENKSTELVIYGDRSWLTQRDRFL